MGATTAAVVLAAGRGSRFEAPTPKLLAPFRGRPLLAWAVSAAMAAGLDETVVVTGGTALPDDLLEALGFTGEITGEVTVVVNEEHRQGLSTSLQAAVRHATGRGHDAVVVGLGDQPLVPAEAWRRVGRAQDRPLAVATYDGERRNPVRLAAEVWPLLPTAGDTGARELLRARPAWVREVACPGRAIDIDTVEDLDRWS